MRCLGSTVLSGCPARTSSRGCCDSLRRKVCPGSNGIPLCRETSNCFTVRNRSRREAIHFLELSTAGALSLAREKSPAVRLLPTNAVPLPDAYKLSRVPDDEWPTFRAESSSPFSHESWPLHVRIPSEYFVGSEAGSGSEAHCLNPACQFTRTVIGASSTSSGRDLIRKRRPSVATSYGEETLMRLKPKTRV